MALIALAFLKGAIDAIFQRLPKGKFYHNVIFVTGYTNEDCLTRLQTFFASSCTTTASIRLLKYDLSNFQIFLTLNIS